jgi:hypothetical protein
LINVKNILQTHFFAKILKEGADINKVWSLVDERKLHDGITDLIREVQRSKQDHQNECLRAIDETVIVTQVDCNVDNYPALCQFAVPLVNTSIHALLRDIVALHDKNPTLNLLTFQAFNGKPCTLVSPIASSSYKFFKQNVGRSKWMDSLLSCISENKEEAAEWIMHLLGKKYENKFTEVAARKQRSVEIIQQTIRNVQQAAQKRKSIEVIQRSIRGALLPRRQYRLKTSWIH